MAMIPRGRTIRMTGEVRQPQPQEQQPQALSQQQADADFDAVPDRRHTGSLKYDSAKRHGYPEDVLPLWVADMDFPAAPPILDALRQRVNHGVFGYAEPWDSYYQSIIDWWGAWHGYPVQREWILESPGVVFSINTAIKAFTRPGDGIIIQTPVYSPFYSSIRLNGRKLVLNPLTYSSREYTVNFEDFQQKVQQENVKLFILCNPHNPTGRVWSQMELQRLGNICKRNGVIVVSDEIHCDITAQGFTHRVFAGLAPELEQIAVTLTSPSKTFNLSGLQISHAFIANEELRQAWRSARMATGYEEPNVMGLAACQAAYEKGRPWLEQLLKYIDDNEAYVKEFLRQYIHGVFPVQREGTYLLWLDCWACGFSSKELNQRLAEKGKLWVYDGAAFGEDGEGFQRMNLACSRETLSDALMRMSALFTH
ncbi:MAG: pyridoxal phosphate-dependent aminotransferase [Clostridiales bacterium]|nr:pyridoxal phosphate-dependent aminotransferase [Clostridiales bacterium]